MARIAGSDSAKTRALICKKALELSAQTGFEALTMRALAAAVGVQVAALYHYFPDKQSLLASLLTAHYDRLITEVNALPQAATAPDRLLAFAQFHIAYHATHRPQTLLALQELRSLTRANASQILPKRQAYERVLRHILSDGASNTVFSVPDISLTATALLAMLSEVAIWFRASGKANLHEVSSHFAGTVLKMVKL